ncbi:MAG: outer membrane beta-barrel protein [Bacteroidales bacterium]|jgi:hypothetical protein|nr:outer membrane beta-barrel protein [Bacteroidales bacterium]
MDNKDANIDLLFRNGLKDYEVLPPADVWDNISPAVTRNNRPYMILRAAAMIALLVTIGLLTSTWNSELAENSFQDTGTGGSIMQSAPAQPADVQLLADASGRDARKRLQPLQPASGSEAAGMTAVIAQSASIPEILTAGEAAEVEENTDRYRQIVPASTANQELNLTYFPYTVEKESFTREDTRKWSVAALVSPTYMSSFSSPANEAAKALGSAEQPVVSYAGGVAFAYRVSKRLSVQSGLYYSSYGNQISGISTFGGFRNYDQVKGNSNFEIQTTNGRVATNNADVYLIDNISDTRLATFFDKNSFDPVKASLQYLDNSLMQSLGYLELPLIVRYKVIDRAFDFNIIGGLSSNLLINNSVYTSAGGDRYEIGKTEGLNELLFSSSFGMGMEYNLGRNLSVNLEPTFRYFLNPLNSLGISNTHPYTFGIFSGLSYKF